MSIPAVLGRQINGIEPPRRRGRQAA